MKKTSFMLKVSVWSLSLASVLTLALWVLTPSAGAQGGTGRLPVDRPKPNKPRPRPTPKPTLIPRPTPTPTTRPRPTATPTVRPSAAPDIEMVLVRGGTFLMGSLESEVGRTSDETPQHRVTVPSFYMGKYEVTQAQWRAVMGNNPSRFEGDDRPVENVSWAEAVEFCLRLSRMNARGWVYRLPTEAEWEYACRAGTTGSYAGDLNSLAWYAVNSGGQTQPVGQKRANAFGLHDMHGNVWEWCADVYHKDYVGAPTDGTARTDGVNPHVFRGGSWFEDHRYVRSADRNGIGYPLDYRGSAVGFRVVRVSRS